MRSINDAFENKNRSNAHHAFSANNQLIGKRNRELRQYFKILEFDPASEFNA